GEGWCFFCNGVSYIAVIAGLLMMTVDVPSRTPHEASAIADILEGFRFVGSSAPVRALMLLLGLVSLTGMPYAVLMPVFADRILHSGASGLGILMGMAPFGALLAGGLAGRWGAPRTVAIGGAICTIGAVIFRRYLPRLRSEARQLIVAQESTGGSPSDEVTGERISSVAPIKGSI